jgi:predicted transposase/invertase (TIGR01784 family)
MAEELHQPHDRMVGTVLRDLTAAQSFLQAHLAPELSQRLNWATLKLAEGSFVDEELRRSETDVLYEVADVSGQAVVWLYVLVEHLSAPDRWIRVRLLKYCCRIWEYQLAQKPPPRALRPIIPLIFYQGAQGWSYSTEFAELFAESVRERPWIPHFTHGLIDQSALRPEDIPGELKARLMQLLLLAAAHPERRWEVLAGQLLAQLATVPLSGGIDYLRVFLRYMLHTQEPAMLETVREVWRQYAPQVGDQFMTYAQVLLQEGELKEKVRIITNMLQAGMEWAVIEQITGVNEAQFQGLQQQVEAMNA